VYIVGLSFDKACALLHFFQNLKLSKSQANVLLYRLARHWERQFEVLCTLLANSLVVHADETRWSLNSVWALLSEQARVLLYGVHKDAETLRQILDPATFAGLVISDDAAGYGESYHPGFFCENQPASPTRTALFGDLSWLADGVRACGPSHGTTPTMLNRGAFIVLNTFAGITMKQPDGGWFGGLVSGMIAKVSKGKRPKLLFPPGTSSRRSPILPFCRRWAIRYSPRGIGLSFRASMAGLFRAAPLPE
jgi:hypothetical protein